MGSPAPPRAAPARAGRPRDTPRRSAGEAPRDGGAHVLATGRPRVAAAAGLLVLLAGLVDVLSAVTPEWRDRLTELRRVLPGGLSRSAAALTVVVGVLLVLLSRGLRRRKRRAWRGVVVLLAVSVVLHVAKGLDYEEAIASFVLLVGLVVTREEFHAKGDPATRWRALWVGLSLALGSVLVGLVLIRTHDARIAGPHPFGSELQQVLYGLVGVAGPLRFETDRLADLVMKVLTALGVVTLLVTAYLALRPPEPRPRLTDDDERRMRELLDRHGQQDSLGYFALRGDKSVVWSPSGKACVAYRVVSGVMLASGDPLGDPEAWPGAIAVFLGTAAEHAWVPAVIGCSEAGGTAWSRVGLSALEFGDEAIVELCDFTLEGRAMRNVRQAAARAERSGYECEIRRVRDIPAAEQRELRGQALAWRGTETERGFSMALGRFGADRDGDCVAVLAFQRSPGEQRSPEQRSGRALRGMLHFVPWGARGLSLDLMVRDRTADNGLNEYLIVNALRGAADLGVERMSLNFAFFRAALERGEKLGAGPVLRAWRGLLIFLSRWFQIDSLYRFNAKFHPSWQPRFVCYPSSRELPRIAIAMLEAEAFIVRPRLRPPFARALRRHAAAVR